MSSKKLFVKDLKQRLDSSKFYIKRSVHKYILNDLILPFGLKKYAFSVLFMLNNIASTLRVRNRCVYTYRSRSVNVYFKVSRLLLRDLVWKLLLPGMSAGSW